MDGIWEFDIPLEDGDVVPGECVDLYIRYQEVQRELINFHRDLNMLEQCNTTVECHPQFIDRLNARIDAYIQVSAAVQNALAVCVAINK